METFFNIAGPCVPGEHYMLPALDRCPEIKKLISQRQFFIIHAARQTGKTTLLNSLETQINTQGSYVALYCSLESVHGINDPKEGIPAIAKAIARVIRFHPILSNEDFLDGADLEDFSNLIITQFAQFCMRLKKPLIVFFDEADCLSEQTLLAFLRQLRDGYVNRPRMPFVHSLALVGMRNILNYRSNIMRVKESSSGLASPFNIVGESLTIKNFSIEEITSLYGSHTSQTGHEFSNDAILRAWYWSEGQPWLVNALAREIVEKMLNNDFSVTVTENMMDEAAKTLISRRDTHIDNLIEKLEEPRVIKVIRSLLKDYSSEVKIQDADFRYVREFGLISEVGNNEYRPANPIYAEIITRFLDAKDRESGPQSNPISRWLDGEGMRMSFWGRFKNYEANAESSRLIKPETEEKSSSA